MTMIKNNLKKFIYAGEVQPKDIYQLHTVNLGIEPNVAVTLINIYGGHIHDVTEALTRIYREKEEFYYFFDSFASHSVQKCLN